MRTAVVLLVIVIAVLLVTAVTNRLRLSAPLALMVVGIAVSFTPIPDLHLEPDIVLLGLLPPLLYATAIKTSAIDFRAQLPSIGYLSIGLVVVTALLVGLLSWVMLPIGFAAAFAVGAVVAPPDAVAATAVGKRIGLPRKLVGILEGESLVNDATAITCLRMGIAAMGVSASVSALDIGKTFLLALVGGVAIGAVVALIISRVRRHITEPVVDTALSFAAPFVAYLPAEGVHSSGVIAVVTTGLILGHRAPVIQTAQSRLSERINWSTIQYLLENTVFLLVGLQAHWIVVEAIGDIRTVGLPPALIIGYCAAVLVAVIVIRLGWTMLGYPLFRLRREGRPASRSALLVGGWAGMRGVVTLAAALLLPETTPLRAVLLLVAMVVTAGTLLINGLSLGAVARALKVRGPDPRDDALAMAAVMEKAGAAALRRLETERPEQLSGPGMEMVRDRSARRTNAIWERLGRARSTDTDAAPSEEYRELRMLSLGYEREEVLRIRNLGTTDAEVIERVLGTLDVEESMLAGIESSLESIEEDPLTAPQHHLCEHLEAAPMSVPSLSDECVDCVREGTRTVHLRLCLTCGNVGCCDSSEAKHADRHFRETGHPVMRSFEPGEHWRWCYLDNRVG